MSRISIAAVLTAAVFLTGTRLIDGFGSWYSVSAILTLATFLGVAAAGQTLVMLLGGLDLSIPFLIGMGNVVAAELTHSGWPFALSVVFVLALGAGVGAINGVLSCALAVPSLIVTLATGFIAQGAYQLWIGGRTAGAAPEWLGRAVAPGSSSGPLPVAPVVLFWIALAVIVVVILRCSIFGRELYAVGANPVAARLSLISRTRVWTTAFAASGGFAALTGVLLLGFSGGAQPSIGEPYLFLTIAAVAVGGTSMLGGRGGYGATVVGALLLTELATLLIGVGSSQALQQAALGLLIVLLVAAYGREPHIRTRI